MGTSQSTQKEDSRHSSNEPSLEDISNARRQVLSAEVHWKESHLPGSGPPTAEQKAEQGRLPILVEKAPEPPQTGQDDLTRALQGMAATASHIQEKAAHGKYHPPKPLPGHSEGTRLTKQEAEEASAGAAKAEQRPEKDKRMYFGSASPAEPRPKPFFPMEPDNLESSKFFEKGLMHHEGGSTQAKMQEPGEVPPGQMPPPESMLYAGVPSLTGEPLEPPTPDQERAQRYIQTAADPTYNPILRAKQATAEATPHPRPPPFVIPEQADPSKPESSVYFEHGKKHVVHYGIDEVVPLPAPPCAPPVDHKHTPLAPAATLEQQWGTDEVPRNQRIDMGPEQPKLEAEHKQDRIARGAENISEQVLKAVRTEENAREVAKGAIGEVKEAIKKSEPPPMQPEAALEREMMPQPGSGEQRPAPRPEVQPEQPEAEGSEEQQPWQEPMTPEAERYLALRLLRAPEAEPAGQTEVQGPPTPAPSMEAAGSNSGESGLLDTLVAGISSGLEKLGVIGNREEKEKGKMPVEGLLAPSDMPYPGDECLSSSEEHQAQLQSKKELEGSAQRAPSGAGSLDVSPTGPEDSVDSTWDPNKGDIERPGITIGPASEADGGPCLGSLSGAEDVANRLQAASPSEPGCILAHSPVESTTPHPHAPVLPSGVIVCSETSWSGPHAAPPAIPPPSPQASNANMEGIAEVAFLGRDHSIGTDPIGGLQIVDGQQNAELEAADRSARVAAAAAEAAGVLRMSPAETGDVAFAAATSGALGMDD